MTEASRRAFLVTAGAGAAAVGFAAMAPGASAATPAGASASGAPVTDEPIVAYVGDTRSGRLTLMVGEREVTVTDHALVSRLHAALGA